MKDMKTLRQRTRRALHASSSQPRGGKPHRLQRLSRVLLVRTERRFAPSFSVYVQTPSGTKRAGHRPSYSAGSSAYMGPVPVGPTWSSTEDDKPVSYPGDQVALGVIPRMTEPPGRR